LQSFTRLERIKVSDIGEKIIMVPNSDSPMDLYTTLLDTGTSFSFIYEADLPQLRISPDSYAAQTVKIVTASSTE
jgi:hypothetical protein